MSVKSKILLFPMCLVVYLLTIERNIGIDKLEPVVLHLMPSKNIPFMIVLCGRNQGETAIQLRFARVLLKSAAALTRVNLQFMIFYDSETIYQDLLSSMKMWPQEHQHRIDVKFSPISYPPGMDDFRLLFKPCSTFRLLAPTLLQHIDAAIYLDTDAIFLTPPEDMWEEFKKFNNEQLIGGAIAPLGGRNFFKDRLKVSGDSAINGGILLMNFTRLRTMPGGGFTTISTNLFYKHKGNLGVGDQDILNLFFAENPEYLYDIGCEWNFQMGYCMKPTNCPEADVNGASLVHGAARSFFNPKSFKFLFEAWEEYELGTFIPILMKKIADNDMNYRSSGLITYCKDRNMSSVFTKNMYRALQ